jgi:hypothetical protein
MHAELSNDDKCEVAVALFYVRDLIAEAYRCGLAGGIVPHSKVDSALAKSNALIDCKSVLAGDLLLADRFRRVLENVLNGRDVGDLTDVDCDKIADRHFDWLEVPLRSSWRTLACDSRAAR